MEEHTRPQKEVAERARLQEVVEECARLQVKEVSTRPQEVKEEVRAFPQEDVEERVRLQEEVREQRRQMKVLLKVKREEHMRMMLKASVFQNNEEMLTEELGSVRKQICKLCQDHCEASVQLMKTHYQTAIIGLLLHRDRLDEDIDDLQMREALLKTTDPCEFIRKHNSLIMDPQDFEPRSITHHCRTFRQASLDPSLAPVAVTGVALNYRRHVPDLLHGESREARKRNADFCHITWDPNTAHPNVVLENTSSQDCVGKGNPRAVCVPQPQDYAPHADRFTDLVQVLSKEPLTGRLYLEFRTSGTCYVGLAYKNIQRHGKSISSILGCNDKSWSCLGHGYMISGTSDEVFLLIPNPKSKMAVYLDFDNDTLIFYSVSGNLLSVLSHIKVKFTEPLFLGAVFLNPGGSVEICSEEEVKEICSEEEVKEICSDEEVKGICSAAEVQE